VGAGKMRSIRGSKWLA